MHARAPLALRLTDGAAMIPPLEIWSARHLRDAAAKAAERGEGGVHLEPEPADQAREGVR